MSSSKQKGFDFNIPRQSYADDPPYDIARARKTDPWTSHEAARKITPQLGNIDGIIYQALLEAGDRGATADEIVAISGIKYRSVTPRLKPMTRKGFVIASGKTREGDSGRQQIIWRAVIND